jgi:predicted transcriptional regulator
MGRPKQPDRRKHVPLAIYVPPELRDELQRLAQRERRSLSMVALLLIERGLRASK